ncbi:MAG: FmdB family zinc ribbon protein [Steroidobacteraceae bacterium]
MPFYEYQCQSCQYYVEVMQKITDAPLKKCPSCGRNTLVKLISAPVFRLKGSGWYETDFKSDQEAKRNLAGPDREDSTPTQADKTPAKGASGASPAAKPAETAKPAAAGSASPARKRAKPAARPAAHARAKTGAAKRAARARPGR